VNACELILSLFCIFNYIDPIVKASLTGSIIGNLLLVLGCSLMAGGFRFKVQTCDRMAVGVYGNMAILSSILLILPALFANSLPVDWPDRKYKVDVVSVGTAIILIISYILQLVFQLRTHKAYFVNPDEKPKDEKKEAASETELTAIKSEGEPKPKLPRDKSVLEVPRLSKTEEGEEEMSLRRAMGQLFVATVLVAIMSEVLVKTVEETASQAGLGKVFTGVVIIAIVGNAAEHSTSVVAAYKNKLDISVAIAFGSSLQIALFVFPALVLVSCARSEGPMNMVFTNMEAVAIFFAVLTAWVICADSETTWLEGVMLTALYVVLALLFYFVPAEDELAAFLLAHNDTVTVA